MIDIVVPYVNPNDPKWIELHNKYSNCKGDNSKQRTRDLDIFKYFFRGLAENCPFIRKVHLIVQSPSQIPEWLNMNNTKLHIVYHKDYIPEEFLPTFNTFIIEGMLHRIPNLTENFVYCNDDFFFTNHCEETDFFQNDLPVDNNRLTKYLTCNPEHDKIYKGNSFCFFQHVLKTNQKIEKAITGKCPIYYNYHVALPFKKSLIKAVWDNYGELLSNALKDSKFRREHNFNAWLFRYIQLDKEVYVNSDIIEKDFSYKELGHNSMKEIMDDFLNKKLVCLNDMINDHNEAIIRTRINKIMAAKFPDKCEFEK